MKGRCESDCGRDEVYPATFRNEEETGLKLDDDEGKSWQSALLKNVQSDFIKQDR